MSEEFDPRVIDKILDSYKCDPSSVISILQDIQDEYKYLPKGIFAQVSKAVGLSQSRIFSVATFYENFSLEPKGKYIIKICDGTACHVRKSIPILNRMKQELGLPESEHTTEDLLFTVETVSCLGACGLAPVITVNDKVFPTMTPDTSAQLLSDLKEGKVNA
ncbi:MAG: NAD(P)H-dependent oxidoreductase subunit E [Oscillospiraceae bacterium]|nr:NAD(P)H-dependent oxidoreductase subunit E [Oscillospiraceae bacterium]